MVFGPSLFSDEVSPPMPEFFLRFALLSDTAFHNLTYCNACSERDMNFSPQLMREMLAKHGQGEPGHARTGSRKLIFPF